VEPDKGENVILVVPAGQVLSLPLSAFVGVTPCVADGPQAAP
jgi:hypothetical protein